MGAILHTDSYSMLTYSSGAVGPADVPLLLLRNAVFPIHLAEYHTEVQVPDKLLDQKVSPKSFIPDLLSLTRQKKTLERFVHTAVKSTMEANRGELAGISSPQIHLSCA